MVLLELDKLRVFNCELVSQLVDFHLILLNGIAPIN
jgi:hypothetical protein